MCEEVIRVCLGGGLLLRSCIHMLMPGADTRESAQFSPGQHFFVNIEMKANVSEQIPRVSKERRADPHGI